MAESTGNLSDATRRALVAKVHSHLHGRLAAEQAEQLQEQRPKRGRSSTERQEDSSVKRHYTRGRAASPASGTEGLELVVAQPRAVVAGSSSSSASSGVDQSSGSGFNTAGECCDF